MFDKENGMSSTPSGPTTSKADDDQSSPSRQPLHWGHLVAENGGYLLARLGAANIDRRWIFLLMLLAVGIPVLTKATFPEKPTANVKAVFNHIETLKPGSRVLVSMDYDPASAAELNPMAVSFLRHLASRGHKIYLMTLWPAASPLINENTDDVLNDEFAEKNLEYGKDWMFLGYQAGEVVAIKKVADNLRALFPTDARGTSLENIPMMEGIHSLQDFDLLLNVSAGYPGAKEWVQYATTTTRTPMAVGCTGVQGPQLYPYIPDRVLGILAAIKGAAEYEAALSEKYPRFAEPRLNEGLQRMGPQLWAHLLMICLIVAGNVLYVLSRFFPLNVYGVGANSHRADVTPAKGGPA